MATWGRCAEAVSARWPASAAARRLSTSAPTSSAASTSTRACSEAFELHGLILATDIANGAEYSGLGYPVTDETDDPDVVGGRMNAFEQGFLRFVPAVGVITEFAGFDAIPTVTVKIVDGRCRTTAPPALRGHRSVSCRT